MTATITNTVVTTKAYDAANRLITVTTNGAVRKLEWSDSGELLRDGDDVYADPSRPMRPNEVWQAALGELQLQMTRETFSTWLKPTRFQSLDDGVLTIRVENAYAQAWLSNRLLATIQRTLTSIVGSAVEAKFVVWSKSTSASPGPGSE